MTGFAEVFLSVSELEFVAQKMKEIRALDVIEKMALSNSEYLRQARTSLRYFRKRVREIWVAHDHVVVRNAPPCKDGMSGLLLAAICFETLKPYRGEQIVKHFRMSPWTKALSHTVASGFFHTDINTAPTPPAVTVMQCLEADPGAPNFGQLRVARVADLLDHLKRNDRTAALRFLTKDRVGMVNETSPEGWQGVLVEGENIRFHPESLLAAKKGEFLNPPDMESSLNEIHQAALAVSSPIDLAPGEILIVSNRRALHQRGACTVRFHDYPRHFDARRVGVFHALSEPS